MGALYRIELLGGLRVYQADRRIERFSTHKAAALLAFLACHPRRQHAREALIDWLWPDSDLPAGLHSLRQALSSLRHQLAPPGTPPGALLQSDRLFVQLNADAVVTDVAEFEAALQAAGREKSPGARAEILSRAALLYRGELLPGFYEEWVLAERERLAQMDQGALRRLAAAREEAGDLDRALDAALRAAQQDPEDEEAQEDVTRLRTAADRSPASARAPLHAAPRRSMQAPGDASPYRAVPSPTPPRHLPLQLTRFFGREQEIAALTGLLGGTTEDTESTEKREATESPNPSVSSVRSVVHSSRLVTLTGPGGSGKTRLAIEAARQTTERSGGAVWFVALADLSDARLLASTIADTLGLPRSPSAEPLDQIVAVLSHHTETAPALLVLDNFEQILGANGKEPADAERVVTMLLERVPALFLLITSRQPLNLTAEREFPVLPLATPGRPGTPERATVACDLLEFPSVQLFTDRAQAIRPDFQVTPHNAEAVAALCENLEGIPLAIVLAASWARVLTPAQMLARLSDRFGLLVSRRKDGPSHHQTLWAAIERSYRLLDPPVQRFFTRLSVFRGGWTVEAAEAVCEEPQALEYLAQLGERSMILSDETGSEMRFRMLETLREFGAGQLTSEDQDQLARRRAEYFLHVAEAAQRMLSGPEQGHWLGRLETEHDNLRAVLEWSVLQDNGDDALRLALTLRTFWYSRGRWTEGRSWLREILSKPTRSPALRAKALCQAGAFAFYQRDRETRSLLEESLAMARDLGDDETIAGSLSLLGMYAASQGHYEAARKQYEESLKLHRASGNQVGEADLLDNLGNIARVEGDYAGARLLYERSLEIRRALDDRSGMAESLDQLGNVAWHQCDFAGARALHEKSRVIKLEIGETQSIPGLLYSLAEVARCHGNHSEARLLYEESLALGRVQVRKALIANVLNGLGNIARAQGDFEAARSALSESLAIKREIQTKWGIVNSLEAFAHLAVAQNDAVRAARLWGAAEVLRADIGSPLPPPERPDFDRNVAAARVALGEEKFAAAWSEGRAMSLEQAIALALEDVNDTPHSRKSARSTR